MSDETMKPEDEKGTEECTEKCMDECGCEEKDEWDELDTLEEMEIAIDSLDYYLDKILQHEVLEKDEPCFEQIKSITQCRSSLSDLKKAVPVLLLELDEESLIEYTDPDHPEYDAEFDKKLRKLRPDWFTAEE